ncbi:hypothetical protein GCM10010387_13370 [Streptomyces inusitatus]|uniref:Saccharopine dehydrogenase n=1 Tax=Streptomyces inusitatus TaxID=68221 RepID=A0A918PSP0_9ACTN|nr:saccharopine dehydrogenase [Streptomyces inusitatus]GGZ21600.1 hypothetical protein GCM10010387_13370 [Streptomyces inusitatus]
MVNDELVHDAAGPVLLVGGYGTVGAELARAVSGRWPLLLAGRSPEKAAGLCAEISAEGSAEARRWDLASPEPFGASVRAVVSLVNDPDDRVLRAALAGGIPYVDVTRWTARMQRAITLTSLASPSAPVLLSSGWMGGVVPLVATALADRLGGLDTLDTAIRYDLSDRAGVDSVEFMDRLGVDFEILQSGHPTVVTPLTSPRTLPIGPHRTKVARIDTPEQFTLPLTLNPHTVSTRLGFSNPTSTTTLLTLAKSGFFRRTRSPRWRPLRHRLLYSPGEGGTAILRIEAQGPGGSLTATVTDPLGQAHMTAMGGLLGLRRVLGEDGAPAARAGVVFPESHPLPGTVLGALSDLGVSTSLADTPSQAAA